MKTLSFLLAFFLIFPQITLKAGDNESAEGKGQRVFPKKVEADKNHDGKIDHTETYENGQISKVEDDTDFDGQTDEWVYYQDGKPAKSERDTNKDGKADTWVTY